MLQTVSKLVSVAVFLCLLSCLNIVLLLSYSVSWPPVWNKHLLTYLHQTWHKNVSPGNPFMVGSKGQDQGHEEQENSAGMGYHILVSAGFFYFQLH